SGPTRLQSSPHHDWNFAQEPESLHGIQRYGHLLSQPNSASQRMRCALHQPVSNVLWPDMQSYDCLFQRGHTHSDEGTVQGIYREARRESRLCPVLQQFCNLPETVRSKILPERRIPLKLFERCSADKAALPPLPSHFLWMRSFPTEVNVEQPLETPSSPCISLRRSLSAQVQVSAIQRHDSWRRNSEQRMFPNQRGARQGP